jgi:hypothetical protein
MRIDQEMEMLCKEILQSFAPSAKAKKSANSISKRKGTEVSRAILAKDVEWQVQFEELAEQVAKLAIAACLDAESIAEVKIRIASRSSTALLVREKVAEVAPPATLPSPPSCGCHGWDTSPSPLPENNDEEGR